MDQDAFEMDALPQCLVVPALDAGFEGHLDSRNDEAPAQARASGDEICLRGTNSIIGGNIRQNVRIDNSPPNKE